MAVPHDDNPAFGEYADPSRLVSTQWLAEHLGELYVGVDHQSSGGAKLFRYLGPMSWLPETDDGFGDTGNSAIASLASFNGSLYGGTLNQAEGCEVWRQAGAAFADGFESGDTSAWSATVP